MSVEISVNWNFVGEAESAQVTYTTTQASRAAAEQEEMSEEELPFLVSVLPLQSSVLAPGLSMPVPAR